jgi:hypothetical protein
MKTSTMLGTSIFCFAIAYDSARWWTGMYEFHSLLLKVPILGFFLRCLNTPMMGAHMFCLGVGPMIAVRAGALAAVGYGAGRIYEYISETNEEWSFTKVATVAVSAGAVVGYVHIQIVLRSPKHLTSQL